MRAIETQAEIRAAAAQWRRSFAEGAEPIGTMGGDDVLWHETLEIWGLFGKTTGRAGITRDWNAFGQKPSDFRSNIIVEINQPPRGIDQNLQAVFARDGDGRRWVLHQGRMSVSGSRVTEADFIAATGLQPVPVQFSAGPDGAYHKVAPLDGPAAVVQEHIAAFVALCARARLAKTAPGALLGNLGTVQDWEHSLSPEATGDYEIAGRRAGKGRRRHGEVWKALSRLLACLGIDHSNDRVGQYGPDLFTYGRGPKILFEIKSTPHAHDIFAAIGQLHVYEHLLGDTYRKVLVVPEGCGQALKAPVRALGIDLVQYCRKQGRIAFDLPVLGDCLNRAIPPSF